jgi:hypothetical protein
MKRPPEETTMTRSTSYRLGLALTVATVLLLVLGAGALGIIGAGGRPDLMYLAVIAVGLVGALAARFRAHGMARTLLAMAVAQVLVALIALVAVVPGSDASVVDLLGLTVMYAGMFTVAAGLFARAAKRDVAPGAH